MGIMRIFGLRSFSPTRKILLKTVRLTAVVLLAGSFLTGALPRAQADPIKRKLLEHTDPAYPSEAKRQRIEGAVILRIMIEPDGHVSDVLATSGNPLLTGAAETAAKQWKYSAAPEATASMVQVNFSLK